MVERKMWKALEAAGVTRVDQVGVPFDPHVHEAVTTRPADHPANDHTVGAVLQPGYRMGEALVRPARVIVLQWQGGEARGSGDGTEMGSQRDNYVCQGVVESAGAVKSPEALRR